MAKVKKQAKRIPKGPLLTDFEALALEQLHEITYALREICVVLEEKLANVSTTNGLKVSAQKAQTTEADEQPDGESSIP